MSRVFLGVGHGGTDSGASFNSLKEKDINLNIALACKAELEKYGVEVGISRVQDENDPVEQEVKNCNAFNPDLAVDIHTNSGGGKGFECFHSVVGGLGKTLATNINSEILAMGQNSRGIKTRKLASGNDYYCFIRETKCHAVITECAFIDNTEDVQMINTVEKQKKFGQAYARGILKTLGIKPDIPNQSTTEIFIDKIKDSAIAESRKIGILPSITFAQAILESASGSSELAQKANNLFGIKAINWQGETYTKQTTEFITGQKTTISAKFRAYSNWSESIADHSEFLLKPRYSSLVGEKNYKKAAQVLKDAGYATDLNYPVKLCSVIDKYELYKYDKGDDEVQDFCPQYKKDGELYLRDMLYTTSEHDPLELVDFGTLGIILMNFNRIHNMANQK